MTPERNRGGDSGRYMDWLARAREDLDAAQLLMGSDRTLESACFHCQQCIEKALKAYMLYRTRTHLDGHNLTWLCRQAQRIDPRFSEWLDESAALNRYYIETRYPADAPLTLNAEKVRAVYGMALKMYEFICGEVNLKN